MRVVPEETGEYRVRMGSVAPAGLGAYRLVSRIDPPSPAALREGTTRASLGEESDYRDDRYLNQFRFEAGEGDELELVLRSEAFAPVLTLRGPGSISRRVAGNPARLELTVPAEGTFTVGVTSGQANQTGDYTLQFTLREDTTRNVIYGPDAVDRAPAPAGGIDAVVGRLTYPEIAIASGVEGDVEVEVVVNADGTVRSARALNDPGLGLAEAAVAAVRASTFVPAQRQGQAVNSRLLLTVPFRIN